MKKQYRSNDIIPFLEDGKKRRMVEMVPWALNEQFWGYPLTVRMLQFSHGIYNVTMAV